MTKPSDSPKDKGKKGFAYDGYTPPRNPPPRLLNGRHHRRPKNADNEYEEIVLGK